MRSASCFVPMSLGLLFLVPDVAAAQIFPQLYSNEPRGWIKPGTAFTKTQHPVDLTPGAKPYGPDTCPQGLVWRERVPGDHLCVPTSQRHR